MPRQVFAHPLRLHTYAHTHTHNSKTHASQKSSFGFDFFFLLRPPFVVPALRSTNGTNINFRRFSCCSQFAIIPVYRLQISLPIRHILTYFHVRWYLMVGEKIYDKVLHFIHQRFSSWSFSGF